MSPALECAQSFLDDSNFVTIPSAMVRDCDSLRFPRLDLKHTATERMSLDLATEAGKRVRPRRLKTTQAYTACQSDRMNRVCAGAGSPIRYERRALAAHVRQKCIWNHDIRHYVPRRPITALVTAPRFSTF
jgi:hypothetical protein